MVSKIKAVIFIVLLHFMGAASVMAQHQTTDTLAKVHNLNEVVVNGQQSKRLRSAMPMQQFDAKELTRLNANNISDVAKHLAGVSVKDYGGIGGVKTVSVRGLGAAHTGVSYDGVMINDVQTGQIDLSKFTIENISDITLSNGQPNDFFQPARTFASSSVLSFNSISFKNDSTNPLYAKATLKAGSFGLINPSIILNKGFAKRWSATITADGVVADGEYKFDEDLNPTGQANINEKTRTNGDVHSLKSELRVVGSLKEFETLSLKTNFYYSERGLPGSDIFYNIYSKDRMLDKSYLAQVQYKNKQSCFFQYQAQGSANRAYMRYSAVGLEYNPLPSDTKIDEYLQNEYYLSATAQYYPFNKMALTSALDYIYNDLESQSNLSEQYNSSPIRHTGLANLAAKFFTSRLTIGANLLYTATVEISDDKTAPNRNRLSPALSFSYKLLENRELRIRGFYKNIYRLPTFAELYYHNFGYSELRPEIADQYNLGISYGENKFLFLSDLEFTLDGYYNEVTDKITIRYGIPFSSVRNVGSAIIQGVDVNFKSRLALNKWSGFNIRFSYSYQIAQDRTEGSQNYGEQLPYTPFNSASGSIGYNYRAFETGYNLIYSGIRWDGPNEKENKLNAYAEHSLYAKYSYKKLMLMGEVINFMDTQYYVIKNYPMPGRNYRLTLSYTF